MLATAGPARAGRAHESGQPSREGGWIVQVAQVDQRGGERLLRGVTGVLPCRGVTDSDRHRQVLRAADELRPRPGIPRLRGLHQPRRRCHRIHHPQRATRWPNGYKPAYRWPLTQRPTNCPPFYHRQWPNYTVVIRR